MNTSRRAMLQLAGAGLAAAAWSVAGVARAQVQVQEEADNEPLTIVRKGIDKAIEVINVDLREDEGKTRLSEGVYVFIAHGAGERWTLRENRRAFNDYVFTSHRMGGIVRGTIETAITLLGDTLPNPVVITPMGSHALVHPEGEVATAEGAAKSGGSCAYPAPRPAAWRTSPKPPQDRSGFRCT